jgi:hypothetical protein
MLNQLKHLHAVYLLCDPETVLFYGKEGMRPAHWHDDT